MDLRADHRRLPLLLLLSLGSLGASGPAAPPSPRDTTDGPCVAQLRGPVHLRARPQDSDGSLLSKGTQLEVLGESRAPRRRGLPSYLVKVLPEGPTGFAYLRPRELGAGCPLLPMKQELTHGEEVRPGAVRPLDACAATGDDADCGRRTSKPATADRTDFECRSGQRAQVLDLDGDGRPDRLRCDADNTTLLHNSPRGWFAYLIENLGGIDAREVTAAQAGAVSYVIDIDGGHDVDDDGSADGQINYNIYRVSAQDRRLKIERVFQSTFGWVGAIHPTDLPDSYPSHARCRYQGGPNESLIMRCGRRIDRLLWDPQSRLLRLQPMTTAPTTAPAPPPGKAAQGEPRAPWGAGAAR